MSHFDLADKKNQIEELDKKTLEDGFWNDQKKAQSAIRTRNNLKNIVDSYQALDDTLKSLDETADAIKEVFDEELMALAEEEYDAMAKDFENFEIQVLLSHEYAICGKERL